ncbi:MAG: PEGA domain-containing protein [Candidatus Marinimicrobia bacterium]|nr:PEGA domain-containing protein [Candidatus Neomarinimicrobiota bacterium]
MRQLSVLFILVGTLASGCAYILSTDSQDISISSSPAGAQVVIKTTGGIEVFSGTTPAQAHLKRKNEYIIDVTLEGHKTKQVHLAKSINPKTFWNLLNGGIGGWIIDGVSGAIWKLEPETITITLQTASIEGEDRQVLVFSWLDAQGKPVHQAIDISD